MVDDSKNRAFGNTNAGPQGFPLTDWRIISQAKSESPEGTAAFGELYRRYWPPIYWYAKYCWRHNEDDAKDLTQGFFCYMMEKWARVEFDPDKGRFRTWLIKCARNFFTNDWKRPKPIWIPFDAPLPDNPDATIGDLIPLPADKSEDSVLDRAWAFFLIRRSFQRLREENSTPEKVGRYCELLPYLSRRPEPASLPPIAARLGIAETALRQSLSRLRKHFAEILREEVSQTVSDFKSVDDELLYLMSLWDGQMPSVAFPSGKPAD